MSKTPISVANQFYIERFRHHKPSDLARDTGLDVRTVRSVLRKLPEAEKEPENNELPSSFQKHRGTVCMTQAESMRGEQDQEKPREAHPLFSRLGKCVHVIDPSLPVQ